MALKKFKPTTPGQRFRLISAYDDITTDTPEKSLLEPLKKSGGRNNTGKMTMRFIGGGHKQKYRRIDFKRDKDGVVGTVKTIEYDPNRSARIALIQYADGEKRYIIAPKGLQVGQEVKSGTGVEPEVGNTLYLKEIPFGTIIHNIELRPGQGAKMTRSAGAFAQLVSREGKFAVVKLPSGETRLILQSCRATIGMVSNSESNLQRMGKAGANRWKGRRPRTNAVRMNPVDHPMGGGEGRSTGGIPRSKNGIAKGTKTRNPKNKSEKYIIEHRKSKNKR
jgi:large subunit ribosomal protein L2